tara:strand:+ start:1232 stop:1522 length:291 start_codon:yes stop_codon:yes gene_type:complete
MEESKLPEDYESQLIDNDLRQCEYLFRKHVPINNIINLGPKSLIIKNGTKIVCIQIKNNKINTAYIKDGKKEYVSEFDNYMDMINSSKSYVYGLST